MRRLRVPFLLLTAVSLLLVPGQADAQVDHPYRVEALVTGFTDPDPNDPHNLGINRVQGASAFEGLTINAVIDCEGEIVVVPALVPVAGDDHTIPFTTDDDLTDGFGEVAATDADRELEGAGVEFRVPPGLDDPAPAQVRVRILSGRFHRIANVVEVDLRLDIRVVRNPGTPQEQEVCETTPTREPEIRINFLIVGPDPDGEGFTLVGEARRHGDLPNDRDSVARTLCGPIATLNQRIDGTQELGDGTPIGPGRGDFHPCPPEGQSN